MALLTDLQSQRPVVPLEVLVVDKPRGRLAVLNKIAAAAWNIPHTDSWRIRYEPQNGGRYGSALNQGASLATFETLMFCDADIRLPPSIVHDLRFILDAVDVACARRRHEQLGLSPFIEWSAPRVGFTCTWTSMMTKATLARVGGWPDTTLTDADFWFAARKLGVRVGYVQDKVRLVRKVHHEWRKMRYFYRRLLEERVPSLGFREV